MKHHLINVKSVDHLIDQIDDSIKNNFKPTLVFIFISVAYDIEYLIKKLKKYKFIVVGSTTVGEIYADNTHGVQIEDKTITCMLTDLDKSAFKMKLKKMQGESFFEFGEEVSLWVKNSFNNAGLLTITSGLSFNNESYLNGIQKNIKSFFGAVSGDDRMFKATFVFSNKKIISNGILALAIDQDKIDIIIARAFGWSGIGTQRIVTKSHENMVYTIDDKPALEFYKDYLNITIDDMPGLGVDYPLEVVLKNGQVVYRAVIMINDDGSLFFAGHVPEGAKVRFSAPIGELVIDEVTDSINVSLEEHKKYKADLILTFPCTAHKTLLGSFAINEIKAVYAATQNTPLVGFYAYGEIASSVGDNAFHNETFVTVQLREKS